MRAEIHRPAPLNTATSAWFTAAKATPAATQSPANSDHCDQSYEAASCTMPATITPCRAPSAAAGRKARKASSADGRREASDRRLTACRATKVASPPNHSAAVTSSGIADAPNRLVPAPLATTGFETTSARSAASVSV